MSKYTPGKWQRDPEDLNSIHSLGGPEGDIICNAPEGYEASMAYWPANAALISAAPDLLVALEWAIGYITHGVNEYHVSEVRNSIDAARAAIAKATTVNF